VSQEPAGNHSPGEANPMALGLRAWGGDCFTLERRPNNKEGDVSMLTQRKSVFLLSITATVVLAVTNISFGAKGGKGKPGGDPPVLPNVRYTITADRIPLPESARGVFVNTISSTISSFGMVCGWIYFPDEERSGFLYDQRTKHFHDLDNLTHLFQIPDSWPADWWTVWKLNSAVGINDSGDVVGYVTDATGFRKGYMLETRLSQNPADWTFQFLPDLGSDYSYGRGINRHGDVLGLYRMSDGTMDAYLYNPRVDGPAGTPPLPLEIDVSVAKLNNHRQVAGQLTDGRAFFFDPDRPDELQLQVLDDYDYKSVRDLNDNGVFCGSVRMRIDGRGSARNRAFRYGVQLEPIMLGRAVGINSDNDVLASDEEGNLTLVHTGLDPNDIEQIWAISDLISDTNPLKTFWAEASHGYYGIADRNVDTGFSQIVENVAETQPDGSQHEFIVILTPVLDP
jgi:hypothetical protein